MWWLTAMPVNSQPAGKDNNSDEKKLKKVFTQAKRSMHKKDWQKAIQQFDAVIKGLPDSSLVDSALYWQAYSLNRLSRELESVDKLLEIQSNALELLEVLQEDFPSSRFLDDARILKVEIADELVKKGFKEYKRYIEKGAKEDDNIDMKLIALDALINMDKEKAFPILEKIILTNPNAKLREKALFILSQTNDPKVVPLLVKVAKEDKSARVKEKAIFWLGQTNNKTALKALTGIYGSLGYSKNDIRLKKKIVFSISQLDTEQSVKTLIRFYKQERDMSIKKKILFWLGQSKSKAASEFIQGILFE
jgi:outer membrane protein assembly factor BamD (BamD/ComL family)